MRHSSTGTLAALVLLWAIVVYGPLAFGAVLLRDRLLLMALSVALLGGLLMTRRLANLPRLSEALPALALATVGLLGWLQSLAWPRALVAWLAPNQAEFWAEATALSGQGDTAWVPLSVSPAVSRLAALEWLALAACFFAAMILGRDRRMSRAFALVLLMVAVFEVIYGADHWLQRQPTIWGVEVPGDPGRLRGTFVNPNHFAFFLALPAAACFAWMWWASRRLRYLTTPEWQLLYIALPGLFFLVSFVGIAFSGSRGGMLALAGALVGQTLLLMAHYRRWRVGLLGVAALVVGAVGLSLIGWRAGFARFFETSVFDVTWNDRLQVYGRSLELWSLFPNTGTGLGTFRQAFPLVQPVELGKTWTHAHNDLIEALILVGWPGALVLFLGALALGKRLWQVFQEGRRSEDRALALAACGAGIAALLHSLVDFGLAVPANAWCLAIFCGLACGAPVLEKTESP